MASTGRAVFVIARSSAHTGLYCERAQNSRAWTKSGLVSCPNTDALLYSAAIGEPFVRAESLPPLTRSRPIPAGSATSGARHVDVGFMDLPM